MAWTGRQELRDGRTVLLRTAVQADVPGIERLFTELSPESYRLRFHSGQPSPGLVARLARIGPPAGTVCLVAVMADEPDRQVGEARLAAEARYVPTGKGAAELGITVRDDVQGTGLGKLLLAALVDRARESGVERLGALVSLANAPMLHLLQEYGWVLTGPIDCAVASLEIAPAGGMPGWPADVVGQRILVEQRGWYDSERLAALRTSGNEIRHCTGPRREAGRSCPLVASGRCRLAEEADLIIPLLPGDDEDCALVLAAHRLRWPDRLGATLSS